MKRVKKNFTCNLNDRITIRSFLLSEAPTVRPRGARCPRRSVVLLLGCCCWGGCVVGALSLQLGRGGSTFLPRRQGTGSIFSQAKKSPPSASPSLTAPPKRAKACD